MTWLARTVNGLLGPFDLHLGRESNFRGLQAELVRRGQELDRHERDLAHALESLREERDKNSPARLLEVSQTRWRDDEPDAGLTWGVPMTGAEFVRFMLSHVSLDGNSTVVEVGPGYGRILDALLASDAGFARYIGLEISAARTARLRERFTDPRIEFRQVDVLRPVALGRMADVTFSSAVFEHLYPDFEAALTTIAACTRPGGAVVLDFVRADEALEEAASWFEKETTYIRLYSGDELRRLFARAGFSIDAIEKISFGEDIDGREIVRTAVFGRKAKSETVQIRTEDASAVFDPMAFRTPPPADSEALDPPVRPAFASPYGGLWTDLETAEALVAGKVATGVLSGEDADLVTRWRRDGYVIIPGAVDSQAIDRALRDFDRAYDGELPAKMSFWDTEHHRVDASRAHIRKHEAKVLDLHALSEAAQDIVFAPRLARFLHILFERPALAFQSLGFGYGSQQGSHQDSAFVKVNSSLEFVASWIALEDIQPGSGELEYYPGSHRLGPYLFGGERIWAAFGEPELNEFAENLRQRAASAGLTVERFCPRKGDVLVWSATLIHGGSAITDPDLTRKSLVTHYCPADLQPMYAYKGGREKRRTKSGDYVMAEQWD